MPVPVTRNTETKKCRNVQPFMSAQYMTVVGSKNLGCRDFMPVLLKTTSLESAITLMLKSRLLTDYEVTQDKIRNF